MIPSWYTAVFILWGGAVVLAIGVYLKRDDPEWRRQMPVLQLIIAGQIFLGLISGLALLALGSR